MVWPAQLTIPQLQLLDSLAPGTLHGWHQSFCTLPTTRRTLFWDLGCTRSLGSRAAIKRFQNHALYYGIATKFCRCNKSFVFANSESETSLESCTLHFPTTPPCSTRVDVLILFSLPQMKNLGTTIDLDPKGDDIACPAFWLVRFSSRRLHNGRYCFGLDESCVSAKIA